MDPWRFLKLRQQFIANKGFSFVPAKIDFGHYYNHVTQYIVAKGDAI